MIGEKLIDFTKKMMMENIHDYSPTFKAPMFSTKVYRWNYSIVQQYKRQNQLSTILPYPKKCYSKIKSTAIKQQLRLNILNNTCRD